MNIGEYWDREWTRRCSDGLVPKMNRNKMAKVIYELAVRHYLDKLEKLDIGSGTGVHALILSGYSADWIRRYTGIDLSSSAVKYAKSHGLNMVCGDFFEYDFGKKFECFLMLDSLEHINDHTKLAKKVLSLAKPRSIMIVNVPLYSSAHVLESGLERVITPANVRDFYEMLGTKDRFYAEVYGSYGYPYLFAEGEIN